MTAAPVIVAAALLHALPWYFGLAAFVVWAAAVLGFTLLLRRRLRAKAQRRRDRRRPGRHTPPRHTRPTGPLRDDRSLGSGRDLERW